MLDWISLEKAISLCKINETSSEWENVQSNKPVCLFIGNTTRFQTKIMEHLFLYNPQKSAMHLEKWFKQDVILSIGIWSFRSFMDSANSDYLEKLETILLKHYNPLLGKQRKKT